MSAFTCPRCLKKVDTIHTCTPTDLVRKLEHEIERLVAELAECRRDAERYRWLRERIENDDYLIARASEWCLTSWCEDDPDRYIDAVLAAKGE